PGAGLTRPRLTGARLRRTRLPRATLLGARLARAGLPGARLAGTGQAAGLGGTGLARLAGLAGATLAGATLRGACVALVRTGLAGPCRTAATGRRAQLVGD